MGKRKELTLQQSAVYNGILAYQKAHGFAPTIRELCVICGLASTSSVYSHLKSLEKLGYIKRREDAPRAIVVI